MPVCRDTTVPLPPDGGRGTVHSDVRRLGVQDRHPARPGQRTPLVEREVDAAPAEFAHRRPGRRHHAGRVQFDVPVEGGLAADEQPVGQSEADQRRLAATLMREDEELTPELLEGAVEALRRRHLQRRQRQIQVQIAEAERREDSAVLGQLLREKLELDRTLAGIAGRE